MNKIQSNPRSWWWDSHISPENSKWLSENLQEMEMQVKETLRFLEEEGEFSTEKAEVYYQERPMLVNNVKNFYRMYCALAERYDNVTGELRKNIPSSLQLHGSGGISESDSETRSEKMAQQKTKARSDCFDVSIGSGASSDASKKGSDGSLSSESDSELDEAKEENDSSMFFALSQRIIELEVELNEARGKLDSVEEKNLLHISGVENEKNLEKDLQEVNSVKEALEAVLLANKNEIDGLKEAMASMAKQFEIELAHRDLEVDKWKQELGVLQEKYVHHKSALEAEIETLQGVITNFEGEVTKISQEKSHLESRIKELEQALRSLDYLEEVSLEKEETIKNMTSQLERALQENSILQKRIKEMEQDMCDFSEKNSLEKSYLSAEISKFTEANSFIVGKLTSMEAELKQAYTDKEEESIARDKQISVLNQDLTDLKSKLELISSEKAMLDDKLSTLLTDIATRDEKIKHMDDQLTQLQLEHAKAMAEADASRVSSSEMCVRVSKLEELVEHQKLAISENSEAKREAIRQLCFSLEHYRGRYQQLVQMLQEGHRRPLPMMAA